MRKHRWISLVVLSLFVLACSCLPASLLSPAGQTPAGPSGQDSGGSGDQTPVAGGGSEYYDRASQFAGHWTGTWNNTTFSTTGGLDVNIDVQTDGDAFITVDITGNVLGSGGGAQLSIPGRYDDAGLIFDAVQLPLFGTMNIVISWDGTFVMGVVTPPDTDILYVSAQGLANNEQIQITYGISYKLGTLASGTATLSRAP